MEAGKAGVPSSLAGAAEDGSRPSHSRPGGVIALELTRGGRREIFNLSIFPTHNYIFYKNKAKHAFGDSLKLTVDSECQEKSPALSFDKYKWHLLEKGSEPKD